MRSWTFIVLLAGLASCSGKQGQSGSATAGNCAALPRGFHHFDEEAFWSRPMDIGWTINQITIRRSGEVEWNSAKIDLPTLEKYLDAVAGMNPVPDNAVDFPAGAPCATIRAVRARIEKHLGCTEHLCLQGNYEAWRRRFTARSEAKRPSKVQLYR
jgi:hypothetical protein